MKVFDFNPLQIALKPLFEKAQEEDELFALSAEDKEARGTKSFSECCEYILGEAYHYASEHKQGNFGLAGCDDAQLISMIKHYYDEDNIEVRKVGSKAQVKVAKTQPKPEPKPQPKVEEYPSLF